MTKVLKCVRDTAIPLRMEITHIPNIYTPFTFDEFRFENMWVCMRFECVFVYTRTTTIVSILEFRLIFLVWFFPPSDTPHHRTTEKKKKFLGKFSILMSIGHKWVCEVAHGYAYVVVCHCNLILIGILINSASNSIFQSVQNDRLECAFEMGIIQITYHLKFLINESNSFN